MITGWQKSQEMGDQTPPSHLDDLPNVGARVGHQHDDKIQNMKMKKKRRRDKHQRDMISQAGLG
jgi:hypothetical protein